MLCKGCGADKVEGHFHMDAQSLTGRRSKCKECVSELNRAQWSKHSGRRAESKRKYREQNPETVRTSQRAYKLSKQYNLSQSDVDGMFAKQRGRCAICEDGLGATARGASIAIDHSHKTGQVRGLLCHRCNTGLGLFRDSPDLLLRAAKYVVPSAASEVIAAFLEAEAILKHQFTAASAA